MSQPHMQGLRAARHFGRALRPFHQHRALIASASSKPNSSISRAPLQAIKVEMRHRRNCLDSFCTRVKVGLGTSSVNPQRPQDRHAPAWSFQRPDRPTAPRHRPLSRPPAMRRAQPRRCIKVGQGKIPAECLADLGHGHWLLTCAKGACAKCLIARRFGPHGSRSRFGIRGNTASKECPETDRHYRRGTGGRPGGAVAACKDGFAGPITMVGDEAYPPLSAPAACPRPICWATFERARLFLKADSYYAETGCRADPERAAPKRSIPPSARSNCSDGRKLAVRYKLLLTTGARVRRLRCPGADLSGVHYLKTIADVDGLAGRELPGRQAHRHRRRRLYRAGSGRGGRQARAGRHRVRGDGPADGARRVAAAVGFLCRRTSKVRA